MAANSVPLANQLGPQLMNLALHLDHDRLIPPLHLLAAPPVPSDRDQQCSGDRYAHLPGKQGVGHRAADRLMGFLCVHLDHPVSQGRLKGRHRGLCDGLRNLVGVDLRHRDIDLAGVDVRANELAQLLRVNAARGDVLDGPQQGLMIDAGLLPAVGQEIHWQDHAPLAVVVVELGRQTDGVDFGLLLRGQSVRRKALDQIGINAHGRAP